MELNHLKNYYRKEEKVQKLSQATNISACNISDWSNPNKKSTPNAEILCKIV